MKFFTLSLLAGFLASCSAPGFPQRHRGAPAALEITLERSVTKYH